MLVRASEIVERSDEPKDQVFAELWRKPGAEFALARHIRVCDGMTAEVIAEHLKEVVA